MNAQKQVHREGNVAPVPRGIWAFPYPHHDPFFYWHRWEQLLPKKYKNLGRIEDDELRNQLIEERAIKLLEIQKRNRPKRFWYKGPFYSLIPHTSCHSHTWYLWENAGDWVKAAGKHIWQYHRTGIQLHKLKYSKDHLQIFVPMQKHLPKAV